MGNESSKHSFKKPEKLKVEIVCMKVKSHLELQRDRKISQANAKEQQLLVMLNGASRSKVDEEHKAASIVSDIAFIDACNIVIRCCDILKDRSITICDSFYNREALKDLIPYIYSIIWSKQHLNLDSIQEFTNLMSALIDKKEQARLNLIENVDPQLKKCFENILPTPSDISAYLLKLSQKTGITVSFIESVGHQISDQPRGGKPQELQHPVNTQQYQCQSTQQNINLQQGNQNAGLNLQVIQDSLPIQFYPINNHPLPSAGDFLKPSTNFPPQQPSNLPQKPINYPQLPIIYPHYPQNESSHQPTQHNQSNVPPFNIVPPTGQNLLSLNVPGHQKINQVTDYKIQQQQQPNQQYFSQQPLPFEQSNQQQQSNIQQNPSQQSNSESLDDRLRRIRDNI